MTQRIGCRVASIFALLACLMAGPLVAQEEPQLSISKYGVGTAVEDRELQGKGDRFDEGVRVWFWTLITGGTPDDRISHVWLHDGKEVVTVGLSVGGDHWRTWSNKTLHPGSAGNWVVEARGVDGNVLARAEFTCVATGDGGGGSSTADLRPTPRVRPVVAD